MPELTCDSDICDDNMCKRSCGADSDCLPFQRCLNKLCHDQCNKGMQSNTESQFAVIETQEKMDYEIHHHVIADKYCATKIF